MYVHVCYNLSEHVGQGLQFLTINDLFPLG